MEVQLEEKKPKNYRGIHLLCKYIAQVVGGENVEVGAEEAPCVISEDLSRVGSYHEKLGWVGWRSNMKVINFPTMEDMVAFLRGNYYREEVRKV